MEANRGKQIVSGMMWRFAEKITAQSVSFIVSIVLARILMPDDYGVVAIVCVFTAIAEIFVTSGLGTALIQKKNATQVDFSTVFWCNLALSCIIYAVIFFAAPYIAAFYKFPLLTLVIRVLAIKIPINAFNSIQNAYVSRKMQFKKFFFATIIGTVVSAIVGIYMAYNGFGVWALVAQILTNNIIDTIVLFLLIEWKPKLEFSFQNAKPLFDYGWKILATDLVGTIFNNLNAFIIGKKYSSADLAYYERGKKFPDMINNNVGTTLSSVLFPAMSLSDGLDDIRRIRRKSLKMMEYVMFPLMLGMFVVADKMILVLLTEKWLFAVPFVRISCISAVVGILGTTLIQEIKAIGRSDITLKLELIKKPIYLVVVLIAMQISVKAMAYSLIIIDLIAFGFNVYPVRKYIGFDFKLHLVDALSSLWMTGVMCIFMYGVDLVISNALFAFVAQIVVGIMIYFILSIVSRNDSFTYLKQEFLSKVRSR